MRMPPLKEKVMSSSPSLPSTNDDDVVEPLPEACRRIGVSYSTLRRLIAAGEGPPVVRLSQRRLGILRRHRREWLAAKSLDQH
jgi:predicted DNA-binding transcriptional regulator AlpA